MDINQLLLMWAVLVIAALCLDVGAYLYLRAEWKKSGVLLTDKLWNQLTNKPRESLKAGWERLRAIAKPKAAPTSAVAEPAPQEAAIDEAVEIIPVSVKTIGQVRQVQFSLDMALNTTVNVRMGASGEAGVKVEKREL